jgi:hypothetical protein
MPSVRTLVRSLVAVLLAAVPLLAGLASPARAQVSDPASGTDQAASRSLTIAVTSVTPRWATPAATITVSGTVTNDTGSPLAGMTVMVQTSGDVPGVFPFPSRSAMEAFADGSTTSLYSLPSQEGPDTVSRTLRAGAAMTWSVSFPASAIGFASFGVYPLEAVAYNAYGDPLATDPTLLPYWPGRGSAQPLSISWVWPLIDVPQADACGTLATNSLARSLSGSGRLGTLLAAGISAGASADLTWAVDPALLSDAAEMTRPYGVGGRAGAGSPCEGITSEPASSAASRWLARLRQGTAGQPMFLTPYADADISALAHAGLDSELRTAFSLGDSVARQVLGRSFGDGIAWPASGTADASVLLALADDNGPSTLLLGTDELPGATGTVAHTSSGVGTTDTLLLADSGLTRLLGTAAAGAPAGSQFTVTQDFLAETAMISSEYPNEPGRSLIVAPPQRWDPSAAEAASLLSTTVSAPWLHPAYLSDLARAKGDPQTLPGKQVSPAELSAGYMSQVKSVGTSLATLKNLLYRPKAQAIRRLEEALAVTASSAWRGTAQPGGRAALDQLSGYVGWSLANVQMITNSSERILLAGASGSMLVSVRNNLNVPVLVDVKVTVPPGGPLRAGKTSSLVTVLAGKTATVRIPVSSADISTTTLKLQLVTQDGSPLTPQVTMSVQATRYGRALLILIAAALGVLVLASVARRVRRWLNETRAGSGGTG